jgi:hypothetical protein
MDVLYKLLQSEYEILDPGTGKVIPLKKSMQVVPITVVASATETNTLDPPRRAGLFLVLNAVLVGSGGTRVITLSNSATFMGTTQTALTLSAAGQVYLLYSVGSGTAFKWAFIPLANQPLAGSNYPVYKPLAAPQALSGPGAINVTTYRTNWTTTGANDAGTLANGVQLGQEKRVQQIVDGGDGILTPVSLSGGTTITFADAGDYAVLAWNGTAWVAIELGNDADGVTAPVLA